MFVEVIFYFVSIPLTLCVSNVSNQGGVRTQTEVAFRFHSLWVSDAAV